MGDQNGGAVLQNHVQRFLDLRFGKWIYRGGSFIQDEDGRLADEDSHERDKLTNAHGETIAPLANFSLQAVWQGFEPITIPDAMRQKINLLIGDIWIGVADIVDDSAREEEWRLRDYSELCSVALQIEAA